VTSLVVAAMVGADRHAVAPGEFSSSGARTPMCPLASNNGHPPPDAVTKAPANGAHKVPPPAGLAAGVPSTRPRRGCTPRHWSPGRKRLDSASGLTLTDCPASAKIPT
jgi:hypothetical protein